MSKAKKNDPVVMKSMLDKVVEDIVEVVHGFSKNVDERFADVDEKFAEAVEEREEMKRDLKLGQDEIKRDIGDLALKLSNKADRDEVDEKLKNLRVTVMN